MTGYLTLNDARQRQILATAAANLGLNEQVIEKDAWVTMVLETLFTIPDIGAHLVFKGGTSLSKGYNLIQRFSEDIDFAINPQALGFEAEGLNPSQIKRLRRASNQFIRERLIPGLTSRMLEIGVPENQFQIDYPDGTGDDADPLPVRVHYHSVLTPGAANYLAEQVLVEISARSMMEPAEPVQLQSLIAEAFPGQPFSGTPFRVPAVWPGRTFLEKLFLLHEQFAQADILPPRNRMSRHLYDVEKLMDTDYAREALANHGLYSHVVAHRAAMTPVRGLSYDNHTPDKISFIPPDAVAEAWRTDYEAFTGNMVIGEALDYDVLISRMTELISRMRSLAAKTDANPQAPDL